MTRLLVTHTLHVLIIILIIVPVIRYLYIVVRLYTEVTNV